MITEKLIQKIELYARGQSNEFGAPPKVFIDVSNQTGQRLSKELGADSRIVFIGTNLMDCKLGEAVVQNKVSEHVAMSVEQTQELLDSDSDITADEKYNILACVREHHGINTFTSLESEICCNADCYRFLSIEGVVGGFKETRDMPMPKLVQLFKDKVKEKWNALSLDVCKQELAPQYKAITNFLNNYSQTL